MPNGTRHAAIIDSRYSVSDVTYPRPKQSTPQPTYTRSRPKSARERVEYEVRARFPAKWNETAPATCANVEEEVRAVMREIDREAAVEQGAAT